MENTIRKPYSVYGTPTTQVQFSAAFNAELSAWKKRRPQWKKLCNAIKAEAPRDEIFGLASEAGCHLGELQDLQTLSRRGRDAAGEAKKIDAVEKALAAAEKRLSLAQKALDKGGLSVNEQDAARDEHEAAFFAHEQAKMAIIGPRQAAQTLALAKSENLI